MNKLESLQAWKVSRKLAIDVRHLRISLGSAYELRLHLEIATALDLVPCAPGAEAVRDCARAIGLIVGLLKRLGGKVPGH